MTANVLAVFGVNLLLLIKQNMIDEIKSRIASNRGSEYRGEYVPGPCTHHLTNLLVATHDSALAQKMERVVAIEGGVIVSVE